jgi:hypothetical protein
VAEIVTLDPLTLCDLDTARAYLKSESVVDDDVIKALINHASAQIEMHCRRYLFARDYNTGAVTVGKRPTLKLNGTGSNWISFGGAEFPINTVTSMTERFDDGVTTRTLNIAGLRILMGHKVRIPYDSFTQGERNIEVVCNLGYEAATHARERRALESACLRFVQVLMQDREAVIGRGTTFGVGGETVQLIADPIPADIQKVLQPFVRLV